MDAEPNRSTDLRRFELFKEKYASLHEQVLESMSRERRMLEHAKRLQQDRIDEERKARAVETSLATLGSDIKDFEVELAKVQACIQPHPATSQVC